MFESRPTTTVPTGAVVDSERVLAWVRELATAPPLGDDRQRLDVVHALERLVGAAQGLQAQLSVDVDASMREKAAERGTPLARQGQGIAAEIALARRESPHRGRQHLGLARVLSREMPFAWAAFRAGRLSEWRATILARETACLSAADRIEVDHLVAGDPEQLEQMGDHELGDAVRRHAYELDAEAWLTRRRIAESERRVTLRPAPDVMARLSAELPVAQGVALLATLGDRADTLRAQGDARSRGQLMADTLVARVLGNDDETATVPVSAELVVADSVLLGDDEQAAHLQGFGPVPAELARELVRSGDEQGLAVLRRLYVKPETGDLVAADSRSRCFEGGLARFIELRDQACRTPWCDAPIRHHDHVLAVALGGETSAGNGQGLCEACNYAKEAFGWRAVPSSGDRQTVDVTTPSGRTVRSTSPPLPGGTELRVDFHFPVVLVA